jgi:hypothetical protein
MSRETQASEISTRQAKRDYWSHHIDTWQISGLTQVQYCRENQLNKCTFAYWKSKLEKHPSLPSLLPVTVRTESNREASFLHSGIVLSFNDRLSIRLENGFNGDTLSRLIDLLERR